ncbi:MAG TPA: dethiobiotin synthase [Syntrophales bacterium]|nr:dethiobiotin synthase [Syntrophales bacterium]
MKKSERKIEKLFVVGTDTGVGKTVLSLLMMQFFLARGYDPFYLKPVQTGCKDADDAESDARFIYRNVELLRGKDPAESVIYCFPNPKAPFYAARDDGKRISLSRIKAAVSRKALLHSPLVIEGAGGLFVPVTGNRLVIDMIGSLDAVPVVAARAGLGTINHTLLTIEALKNRGFNPRGIVFLDGGEKETAPEMVRENVSAVEESGGVRVAGVIGRIDDFSKPPHDCYRPLVRMFG